MSLTRALHRCQRQLDIIQRKSADLVVKASTSGVDGARMELMRQSYRELTLICQACHCHLVDINCLLN